MPTRSSSLTAKAPRVDAYVGTECAAEGCSRPCRAMSRYCTRHAGRYYRTRNPNGRIPRRSELAPWKGTVEWALATQGLAEHPAVAAAERVLEEMILRTEGLPKRSAAHWRRLSEGGATGRAMLVNILTVYGWLYVGLPKAVGTDDAIFFCTLGSRFLRTVSTGWYTTSGGKLEQIRLPGRDCEEIGRALAERVGVFALQFWQRVETEAKARQRETTVLRDVLTRHPL